MIRSELVARIAGLNPHLYAKDVEVAVDAILGRIEAALMAGNRVELRDFGAFSVREHDARPARNPKTGATIIVEARSSVHFKAGRAMRARLNLSGPQAEPEALLEAS